MLTLNFQTAVLAFLVLMVLTCWLSKKSYGPILIVGAVMVLLFLIAGNPFIQSLLAFIHR